MSNKKKKPSEAEEPATDYAKKRIVFFNSFEEMNEYDIKEMAASDPVENLKQVTYLIENLYADELNEKRKYTRLHFYNP